MSVFDVAHAERAAWQHRAAADLSAKDHRNSVRVMLLADLLDGLLDDAGEPR